MKYYAIVHSDFGRPIIKVADDHNVALVAADPVFQTPTGCQSWYDAKQKKLESDSDVVELLVLKHEREADNFPRPVGDVKIASIQEGLDCYYVYQIDDGK